MKDPQIKKFTLILITLLLVIGKAQQKFAQIKVGETVNIYIEQQATKAFSFKLQNKLEDGSKVYFFAEHQQKSLPTAPLVTYDISQSQEKMKQCYQLHNQFATLCTIDSNQTKSNSEIKFYISPFISGNFSITLNVGSKYIMEIDKEISFQQGIQEQQVIINIPEKKQFNEIIVVSSVQNSNVQNINQGISMYINLGKDDQLMPTVQKYQYKAYRVWGNNLGYTFGKQDLKQASMIKVLLIKPKTVKVILGSKVNFDNRFSIRLQEPIMDTIPAKHFRFYVLDLSSSLDKIKDKTLNAKFVIYAGNPSIHIQFQDDFDHIEDELLNIKQHFGTVNYEITPQMRQKANFNGTIYFKIQANQQQSVAYFLQVKSLYQKIIPLRLGVTEMQRLVDKNDVKNLIYTERVLIPIEQEKNIPSFDYQVKIELIKGSFQIGVRTCQFISDASQIEKCAIQSKDKKDSNLKKQFSFIDTVSYQTTNIFYFKFSTQLKGCYLDDQAANSDQYLVYMCFYHFLIFLEGQNQNGVYALTLYRVSDIHSLKEGMIERESVNKQNLKYFRFELPKDINNIKSVTCIVSTIQGEIVLFASNITQNPNFLNLNETNKNVFIAPQSKAAFSFDQFKDAKSLYFSVFGKQASDFTISIILKKISQAKDKNQTITSFVQLKKSVSLNYTLSQQESVLFYLLTYPNKSYSVQLTQLQGYSNIYVFSLKGKQANKADICPKSLNTQCSFKTQQNSQIYVEVSGSSKVQQQVFSIIYFEKSQETCLEYSLSHPVYFSLQPMAPICLEYMIQESKDIDVILLLSTLDMYTVNLTSILYINQQKKYIQEKQQKILARQLQSYCVDKNNHFSTCSIKLRMRADLAVEMGVMIYELGKRLVLFDGIQFQDKVTRRGNQIFTKYFLYYIYQTNDPIKIMFISQSYEKFAIKTKFINESQLLVGSKQIQEFFPLSNQTFNQNDVEIVQGLFSTIKVSPFQIQKINCTSCVLIIGLVGKSSSLKDQINYLRYKIQISQKFAELPLGSSKIGFISKGQMIDYDISTNKIKKGIVTVTSLHNNQCFKIYGWTLDGNQMQEGVHLSFVQVNNSSSSYKVSVEGIEECSYSIGFYDQQNSVMQVKRGVYYQIDMKKDQIKYFLFKNQFKQSLRIVQMIHSGSCKIYANKLRYDDNLQDFLTKDIKDFDILQSNSPVSSQADSLLIQKNSPFYCFQCYFLIAIQATTSVKEQLIVLWESQSIILKAGVIFGTDIVPITSKESPLPNHSSAPNQPQRYTVNSLTNFKINMNVVSGNVSVLVTYSNHSNIAFVQNIVGTQVISISMQDKDLPNSYLIEDESQFFVNVYPNQASYYQISLIKDEIKIPILSGSPRLFNFIEDMIQFKFSNRDISHQLTVVLQIISDLQIKKDDLEFDVEVTNIDNYANQYKNVSVNVFKTANVFNLKLQQISGDYCIKVSIKNKELTNISGQINLFNTKLTQLLPSRDNLYRQQGVFELYSNKKSLLVQVYTCKGDVLINGYKSPNSAFKQNLNENSKPQKLQFSTYGGHYVLSTPPQNGLFYLDIDNFDETQQQQISYIINYYQFDDYENNPYQRFYTESENILYNAKQSQFQFNLRPYLQRKAAYLPTRFKRNPMSQLNLISIKYKLFIAQNSQDLKQKIQCNIEGLKTMESQMIINGQQLNSANRISFIIQYAKIDQFLNKSIQNKENKGNTFFVGARAQLNIQQPTDFVFSPDYLEFTYNIIQMNRQHQNSVGEGPKPSSSPNPIIIILIFIVVPFMIGSALLFLSFRYCLRQWYMLRPLKLQEDDPLAQSQEGMTSQAQHQEIK